MNNRQSNRQHPIKIIEYSTKNVWMLAFPLARGLIALRFDFKTWLEGAWFDILILFLMLIFGYFRWRFVHLDFCSDAINIKRGIFSKSKVTILYGNITVFSIAQGPITRIVKACKIYVDTNSGVKRKSDFEFTLYKPHADKLLSFISLNNKSSEMKYSYSPSKRHLLFFSFIFSSTLSGVIIISTLIYQSGKIIGNELQDRLLYTVNEVSKRIAFGLPPTAIGLSMVLLGGWFLSFIMNLLRHWKFIVQRQGGRLIIKSGFVTKRSHIINIAKINYVDFRQSLLTKFFKISSVHIHCSGYGKSKREIAVLIPITTRHEVLGSIHMLLPRFPSPKKSIRPRKKQFLRFVLIPSLLAITEPFVGFFLVRAFPLWRDMIVFIFSVCEIPLVWLLIVKFIAYYTNGIGITNATATLNYCERYEFHTVMVPLKRICKVEVKRNVFQIMSNGCDVIIYTNAEYTKSHVIKNLPFDSILIFLKCCDIKL